MTEYDDSNEVTFIGRQLHNDALDFIAKLGVPGRPTEQVYAVALGDERSAIVGNPDLERKLERDALLAELAEMDRPATEDEFIASFESAAKACGIEGA